jgi:siroheme synthase (precorrin-2 oxidase/ferrochelatase)
LLLTVSTGGQVPGLSRALRESLALQFGPEWNERLRELSKARARWRSEGLTPSEVSRMVRAHAESEGWL